MIVSASYRTDIPAFYGAWFMNRLAAGRCRVANPYGGPAYDVALDRAAVSGFVFWTRNVAPFLPAVGEIARLGYPFYVQYTINDYPRCLDRAVPESGQAVARIHEVARRHGRAAAVWRYDPVVMTTLTPPHWHRERFAALARRIAGASDEVVVSFAHIYRKTRRNMDVAARRHGFAWRDPMPAEKSALVADLVSIAADHGMRLTLCTQPGLAVPGAEAARCIDAERLSRVAGQPVSARVKGNRPGCGCHQSRDIGAYDSCPHGCAYCYAVASRDRARRRFTAHDAAIEMLAKG